MGDRIGSGVSSLGGSGVGSLGGSGVGSLRGSGVGSRGGSGDITSIGKKKYSFAHSLHGSYDKRPE